MSDSPAAVPYNSGGTEIATASNPLRVDPTGSTTQPVSGTVTAQQATAANLNATVTGTVTANQGTSASASNRWPVTVSDGSNFMPAMDTPTRRGYQQITDGSNSMPTMDTATRRGYQQISDGTTNATVIAATNALKTDLSSVAGTATVTGGVNGLQAIAGNVADNVADAGNPVKIGAIARTAARTGATATRRVDLTADTQGRLVCCPFAVRELITHQQTTISNSTSETTIASATSGEYHDLISLIITNRSSTACYVTIKDSTGGTTRMVFDLAAYGGIVLNFPAPVNQSGTNANWTATLSVNTVVVDFFVMFVKNV